MILNIRQDHNRFKQIITGKIKQNLKKYISQGELIGKQGKDYISIPVPQIEIPTFKFGPKQVGGVGQGEGEPGSPLSGDPEEGQGQAGNASGSHILEVELTLDDLAKLLGEELELPKILPKGNKNIYATRDKFTGIGYSGPESLRHFKRTYKEALKRQISSGTYNKERPTIVPIKKDKRYKMWKSVKKPQNNAVIIYMMDVSGSMGDEQKEIVRIESFWIDTWLQSQYDGLVTRYIVHDATAKEVDRDTFFRTRESGGTLISSAYKLCSSIIEKDYPVNDWNIYPFHFSDGDNWSGEDTNICISLLKDILLPKSNVFCYGQVESRYGSGQFLKDLLEIFNEDDKVITSKIENKEAIHKSIKEFLGKGK